VVKEFAERLRIENPLNLFSCDFSANYAMKASQKEAIMLKRAVEAAIKIANVVIKVTMEAVKTTVAILKKQSQSLLQAVGGLF